MNVAARWLAVLLLAAPASIAGEVVVRLRDGRTVEGELRIEGGRMRVRSAAGEVVAFDVAEVAGLTASPQVNDGPGTRPGRGLASDARPATRPVHGLRGEYFADREMTDLRLVRVDPVVEFHYAEGATPDGGVSVPPNFSARWTGHLEVPRSRIWSFYVEHDNACRLWVDGRLVIDQWRGRAAGVAFANVELEAGRRYDVKLEYRNGAKGGYVRWLWSSPSHMRDVVGGAWLTPPEGTVPPVVRLAGEGPAVRRTSATRPAVTFEAEASDADGSVRRVQYIVGSRIVAASESAPWRATWEDAPVGVHALRVRATDDRGIVAETGVLPLAVARAVEGTAAWAQLPVGSALPPAAPARGDERAGTLAMSGSGDLWGERPAHVMAFREARGDLDLTVRVARLDAAGEAVAGAAAGLALRASLDAGADEAEAFLVAIREGGLRFHFRDRRGGPLATTTVEHPAAAPVFLLLQRRGATVRASWSEDGRAWNLVGTRELELGETTIAGVTVACAGGDASAAFEGLALADGLPAQPEVPPGVILRSGTVLAGRVVAAGERTVRLQRAVGGGGGGGGGGAAMLDVPARRVARLTFLPTPEAAFAGLPAGRAGAIIAGGDFVDGRLRTVEGGKARFESVLFGGQTYDLARGELRAAALAEVEPAGGAGAGGGGAAYEVRLRDRSVIRARSIAIEGSQLVIDEAAGDVRLAVAADDLAAIVRLR